MIRNHCEFDKFTPKQPLDRVMQVSARACNKAMRTVTSQNSHAKRFTHHFDSDPFSNLQMDCVFYLQLIVHDKPFHSYA